MKKVIALLAVACLLLSMVACGNEAKPTNTDPQNSDTTPSTPIGDPDAYFFTYEGTEIRLHADMAAILQALGEPKKYTESTSCAFDGLDKVYVYAGFKIQTYPQNGKDYVLSVELTDDSVATPEGIAIGATKDQVVTAYSTPNSESDTALSYLDTAKKVTLQFLLRDGKVTNIQYLRETK